MKGVFIMHRKKLTTEQKIQMVKLYFEEKASKTEIAERYGVDYALVRDYILKYEVQGIEGLLDQERNKVYSEQLKLQAIEAYKNGEGSLREIATKYGLRSSKQLRYWIKVYNILLCISGMKNTICCGCSRKEHTFSSYRQDWR